MVLLNNEELEKSSIVANSLMNRERGVLGTNSYASELHFNPIHFLKKSMEIREKVTWLDLCCGTGKAFLNHEEHEEHEDNILKSSCSSCASWLKIWVFFVVKKIFKNSAEPRPGRLSRLCARVYSLPVELFPQVKSI